MEEHQLPDTVSNDQTQQSHLLFDPQDEPPTGVDANGFLGLKFLNESILEEAAKEFLDENQHHISAMGCASPRKKKPLQLWTKTICK